MSRSNKEGRRPVVYWAVCPECLTYIQVDEAAVKDEHTATCPYCEIPISLMGGTELATSCRELQSLIEDIERQIRVIPAAIDVHRYFLEQVDYIAATFNDRLDEIQVTKDTAPRESSSLETKPAR
ncbi:MAG: hypothetical protein ACYCXF_05155 [Thermoleophilia bacterium]